MPPTPPHCAEPLTPLTPADANADEGTHDAEYWKQKALDAEQKALALQALLEATRVRLFDAAELSAAAVAALAR